MCTGFSPERPHVICEKSERERCRRSSELHIFKIFVIFVLVSEHVYIPTLLRLRQLHQAAPHPFSLIKAFYATSTRDKNQNRFSAVLYGIRHLHILFAVGSSRFSFVQTVCGWFCVIQIGSQSVLRDFHLYKRFAVVFV